MMPFGASSRARRSSLPMARIFAETGSFSKSGSRKPICTPEIIPMPPALATAEAKPESKPAAKNDNAPKNSSQPVFKVQIMVCHNKLKEGDRQLKGLKGCDYYQENGDWKCTYGASNNYNEIARMRKQIIDLFPSCFIIAFKNGEKMNVNQAIKEFMQNKKR